MAEGKAREIIEIPSPTIDADEVLGALEENLKGRAHLYSSLKRERPYLPTYDALFVPEPSVVSDALGYHLWQVSRIELLTKPQLIPSSLPLIGGLVDSFKLLFHNLVVFYLNTLAAKQAASNASLNFALRLLAWEITQLKDQMSHLPERGQKGDD